MTTSSTFLYLISSHWLFDICLITSTGIWDSHRWTEQGTQVWTGSCVVVTTQSYQWLNWTNVIIFLKLHSQFLAYFRYTESQTRVGQHFSFLFGSLLTFRMMQTMMDAFAWSRGNAKFPREDSNGREFFVRPTQISCKWYFLFCPEFDCHHAHLCTIIWPGNICS